MLTVRMLTVRMLTLRRLMSYIYMQHPFLMFLDHTQRRSTVARTPLDEWSARRRDFYLTTHDTHNPRSQQASGPAARLLRSWVRIPPGHGYLSVVSVVCCQVEVSATSWSLVQRSPTDCCVVVCDLETSRMGAPYVYDIRSPRVNDLTLILLRWRKWWAPNNASK